MKKIVLPLFLLLHAFVFAQKKPLDHSVYDLWQRISTKIISNDGKWAAYVVSPQEGDGELIVQNLKTFEKISVPRGTNPTISEDNLFVVFKIQPLFKDTRQAKIKKKKADDMPKDSLGILTLATKQITKIPRVKNYKMPEKEAGFVVYQLEKPLPDTTKKKKEETKKPDEKKKSDVADADDDPKTAGTATEEGTELVVRNLKTSAISSFKYVSEFAISKKNYKLLLVATGSKKDSTAKAGVFLLDMNKNLIDTLSKRKGGIYKQLTFDENGSQLAYVANFSKPKALQKFYNLYYFKTGTKDTIRLFVDTLTQGLPKKWTVSENGGITFSQNGKRIFFGTCPFPMLSDTNLVDFELAKVDVWNYKDDYLQPWQLKNLDKDLKKSYLAMIETESQKFVQIGDYQVDNINTAAEGNADIALGTSDAGNRVAMQWEGRSLESAYLIDIPSGTKKLIKANLDGDFRLSPQGNYILWYDLKAKNWFAYHNTTGKEINLTKDIPVGFYDEENDIPDDPSSYGVMRWAENDAFVYLYDRFDVWQIDPKGILPAKNITQIGR
ncbi:MAG: S9 family peptidase, partial [Verrucomicrobia bacterium]|nr:S9 family peptidase [Cytophagales bacterium]